LQLLPKPLPASISVSLTQQVQISGFLDRLPSMVHGCTIAGEPVDSEQAFALLDCVEAMPQMLLRAVLTDGVTVAAILDAIQGLLLAVVRSRHTTSEPRRLVRSVCRLQLKLLGLYQPSSGGQRQQLVGDLARPQHLALAVAVMGASAQMSSGAQLTDSHIQLLEQQQLDVADGMWLASCL
jgi:hypothetical protein